MTKPESPMAVRTPKPTGLVPLSSAKTERWRVHNTWLTVAPLKNARGVRVFYKSKAPLPCGRNGTLINVTWHPGRGADQHLLCTSVVNALIREMAKKKTRKDLHLVEQADGQFKMSLNSATTGPAITLSGHHVRESLEALRTLLLIADGGDTVPVIIGGGMIQMLEGLNTTTHV